MISSMHWVHRRLVNVQALSDNASIWTRYIVESFQQSPCLFRISKESEVVPHIKIVSNFPKLESISEMDLPITLRRPLCLQTLMAKGEISIPKTSWPFFWRKSDHLPPPQPMSRTLPFTYFAASFSRGFQSLYSAR